MKPYSKDLRLKVLEAVEHGMDRREVVRVFGVSIPSIKRWLKMSRETGDVGARPIPGPPAGRGLCSKSGCPPSLSVTPTSL